MKRTVKLLLACALLGVLLTTAAGASSDYVVTSYHMDIVVGQDNVCHISETIVVDFSGYKHGIYRKIPLEGTMFDRYGTQKSYRAKVSNVMVNANSTAYNEGDYRVIKIGDPNKTVTGSHAYRIQYDYNLGEEVNTGFDELYFNLIGSQWDTTIAGFSFTVTMPKEFDAAQLAFFAGDVRTTGDEKLEYGVDGLVISGRYADVLEPGQAISLQLRLPEGYFVGAGFLYSKWVDFLFIIPTLGLLLSLLLWLCRRWVREDRNTVAVNMMRDFNSLEVGFLNKGHVDSDDIMSLVLYLESRGYLEIVEDATAYHGEIKVVKLRDYDGTDQGERQVFDGLFGPRPFAKLTDTTNEVPIQELRERLSSASLAIALVVNSRASRKRIFKHIVAPKPLIILLLLMASVVATTVIPTYEYDGPGSLWDMAKLSLGLMPFVAIAFSKLIPLLPRLGFGLMAAALGIGLGSNMPIKDAIINDERLRLGVLVGVGCIVGMGICLKFIPKRTAFGNMMYRRVKALKSYLKTESVQRVGERVSRDPTYANQLLPYAYVLGLADGWLERMETQFSVPHLPMLGGEWRRANRYRTMSSIRRAQERYNSAQHRGSPRSWSSGGSSGGWSSGGGSSGGGHGGGGGGSW